MPDPTVSHKPTFIQIPEHRQPRKKALLIGLGLDSLGPHRDVHDMEELLLLRGYKEESIVVMKDGIEDDIMVPTRCNMIRAMKRFVHDAQPGDRFFFHFSGPSSELPNMDGTSENGKDAALITSDEKLIRCKDLRRYLVDPLSPGVVLIAIFDTCHSGTMLDLSHYRCNQVWVPWLSKGVRGTATLHSIQVRRPAILSHGNAIASWRNKDIQGRRDAADLVLQNLKKDVVKEKEITENMTPTFGRGFIYKLKKMRPLRLLPSVGATMETGDSHSNKGQQSPDVPDNGPIFYSTSSSPIRRCESPIHIFECDGWCREKGHQDCCLMEEPYVVSLSACTDDQSAWEHPDGKSMTQLLLEFLRKQRDPSLKDLLKHVSHRIHSQMRELHSVARQKRKSRPLEFEDDLDFRELEKDNFQDPQLASLHPLDLNDLFIL